MRRAAPLAVARELARRRRAESARSSRAVLRALAHEKREKKFRERKIFFPRAAQQCCAARMRIKRAQRARVRRAS
jgi:hypothetical protein